MPTLEFPAYTAASTPMNDTLDPVVTVIRTLALGGARLGITDTALTPLRAREAIPEIAPLTPMSGGMVHWPAPLACPDTTIVHRSVRQ